MLIGSGSSLVSSRDVGGHNRAKVLRVLVDNGPLARAAVAQLTGVARATIGLIVQGLVDDGLLIELDPIETGVAGKPATPLWFRQGAGSVVAVDVRRGSVQAARVDPRGEIIDVSMVQHVDPDSADEVNHAAVAAVTRVLEHGSALGVGIAVPGTSDLETAEVLGSAQVPGALGTQLVLSISGASGLPTYLENDSRAQALAERWFGFGRGVTTYATLQTGEGLGAGLVLDGAIYRGPRGVAGELGHTVVVLGGERCSCGQRGCWETIATLRWLRRRSGQLRLPSPRSMDAARLAALAASGLVPAERLLAEYADNLAVGITTLSHLLGCELVILHGDAARGGPKFVALISGYVQSRGLRPVQVVASDLAERATILGAGATALAEVLHLAR